MHAPQIIWSVQLGSITSVQSFACKATSRYLLRKIILFLTLLPPHPMVRVQCQSKSRQGRFITSRAGNLVLTFQKEMRHLICSLCWSSSNQTARQSITSMSIRFWLSVWPRSIRHISARKNAMAQREKKSVFAGLMRSLSKMTTIQEKTIGSLSSKLCVPPNLNAIYHYACTRINFRLGGCGRVEMKRWVSSILVYMSWPTQNRTSQASHSHGAKKSSTLE